MSAISNLNDKYSSFFWGSTKFAFYPYTKTFRAFANDKNKDELSGVIAGALVTSMFTFIVPILPAISSVTFELASLAMLMAAMSMLITYPVAGLIDVFSKIPTICSNESRLAPSF